MGKPGFYLLEAAERSKEAQPLTDPELAALPPEMTIHLHTHMGANEMFAAVLKTAARRRNTIPVVRKRLGSVGKNILIEPNYHDDGRMALEYPIKVQGDSFVINPEEKRGKNGGRHKRAAEIQIVAWLRPGDKPKSKINTNGKKKLRRIDQFG